jgi:hypothetical protein
MKPLTLLPLLFCLTAAAQTNSLVSDSARMRALMLAKEDWAKIALDESKSYTILTNTIDTSKPYVASVRYEVVTNWVEGYWTTLAIEGGGSTRHDYGSVVSNTVAVVKFDGREFPVTVRSERIGIASRQVRRELERREDVLWEKVEIKP